MSYNYWNSRYTGRLSNRTVGADLPIFEAWRERIDCVTHRFTQILTWHCCFGKYLIRMGREATAQCDREFAHQSLEDCPVWESKRRVLVGQIVRNQHWLRQCLRVVRDRRSRSPSVKTLCFRSPQSGIGIRPLAGVDEGDAVEPVSSSIESS